MLSEIEMLLCGWISECLYMLIIIVNLYKRFYAVWPFPKATPLSPMSDPTPIYAVFLGTQINIV